MSKLFKNILVQWIIIQVSSLSVASLLIWSKHCYWSEGKVRGRLQGSVRANQVWQRSAEVKWGQRLHPDFALTDQSIIDLADFTDLTLMHFYIFDVSTFLFFRWHYLTRPARNNASALGFLAFLWKHHNLMAIHNYLMFWFIRTISLLSFRTICSHPSDGYV